MRVAVLAHASMLVLAGAPADIAAQQPASNAGFNDSAPVIALDAGMHTGPIRRIAVDTSGTLLLTASDDKSARLWNVATGEPLATLRPPVGPDAIGRLYGAAIARDGRIAVAGTTAAAGGAHRIYLFDIASRAQIRTFDARGGNIKRLEWSPDGTLLAAAYADAPAVRVFDRDGRIVFEQTFTGDAYYLAFSTDGRLAVASSDGAIHLYSIAGGRVAADGAVRVSQADPRGVQFSPDGRLLAVGYLSRQSTASVRVDVFDVGSRQLTRAFVFSDVSQGNLMNVAWRRDGRALYAAGTGYRGRNRFIVKRIGWPDGSVADVEAATNSILDLASLDTGAIVFATAEPSWGVIAGDRVERTVTAPTAQFYEAMTLRINGDASEVSWRYAPDESPIHFNVAEREIRDGAGAATIPAEPSTFALRVTDWENNFNPKLNGTPLPLDPTEVSRAAAVLPGNAGVILGASRSLRRFAPTGGQVWSIAMPTEVRAVSVTRDGKIVVAALLDGTIRWRRATDGTSLLTLFAPRDRRWVLWTDSGYFDVSAGAENRVGWLVNRGAGDQADYYPLSRFRDRYFRPDVIDRLLATADPGEALALANRDRRDRAQAAPELIRQRVEALLAPLPLQQTLPPAVSLVSPAAIESADTRITIEYTLFSLLRSPVTRFDVRIDGRPVESFSNRPPAELDGASVGSVTLTLPARDSNVQIFAANRSGVSAPATLSYRYRAPPKLPPPAVAAPAPPPAAPAPAVADARPRLFLLSVGVSRYANASYNLGFAAKDAKDFSETMPRQNGRFYRQVDVQLLTDDRATRARVVEGLQWLKRVTGPDDVGMLYLAGHGLNDVDDTYYFLPHDVVVDRLSGTSVGEEAFRDVLTTIKGKSIFFVDTCYSGKAIGVLSNPDLTRISNRFSSPEFGVIVFSASHGRQESRESPDWGNGAFTKALVEGLVGRADFRSEGVVTHKGLDYYVSGAVKKLTAGLQTPVTTVPLGLGDFALANVLR